MHHHLIRTGLRTETGLVIETGEAREVHHMCVLAGYGAEAINPYLGVRKHPDRLAELPEGITVEKALCELHESAQQGHL